MKYRVVCPHCSATIEVLEDKLGQFTKCDQCQKPMRLPTPPPAAIVEPPTPTVPSAFDFSAATPKDDTALEPPSDEPGSAHERAALLSPPWPNVYSALRLARLTTFAFFVVYLCSVILQILPPGVVEANLDEVMVGRLLSGILEAGLLLVHLVAQYQCASTPEEYGGRVARVSVQRGLVAVVTAVASISTAIVLFLTPVVVFRSGWIIALLVFFRLATPVLVLYSFLRWLVFLELLGRKLGYQSLVIYSEAFGRWFWTAFWCQMVVLFLEANTMLIHFSPCFALVSGGVGLFVLWNYTSLLRTAITAVAKRAPIEEEGEESVHMP
jgi:hypothetical protein